MKNNIEGFEDASLIPLTENQLKEIDGGSEVSDAFWRGVGIICGTVYNIVRSPEFGSAGLVAL